MASGSRRSKTLSAPAFGPCASGINQWPVSVAAGHYYQGRARRRFFQRLRDAGVLPSGRDGYEDGTAFAAGIGSTDIFKRATANANRLRAAEYAHGRRHGALRRIVGAVKSCASAVTTATGR